MSPFRLFFALMDLCGLVGSGKPGYPEFSSVPTSFTPGLGLLHLPFENMDLQVAGSGREFVPHCSDIEQTPGYGSRQLQSLALN